jgi:hypothetical protein
MREMTETILLTEKMGDHLSEHSLDKGTVLY